MATTRDDIEDNTSSTDEMYNRPVSNDTLVDIEVGKEAERQKAETGQSEEIHHIKARLQSEGNENIKEPKSMEEDMRMGHEDTVIARKQDAENMLNARQFETDRLTAQVEAANEDADGTSPSKKSTKASEKASDKAERAADKAERTEGRR